MAAHSPVGPITVSVPPDQPLSGWPAWLRDMAAAINLLSAQVQALSTRASVRVRTVSATLNNAVANGGILQFDTIDHDTDGFAPATAPFDRLTIPFGLGGLYLLVGWSSGSGTQASSLGMGVLINGTQVVLETNQTITGPAAVNYTLDNGAVEIGRLADGDTIQLRNNSVSAGTNAFTSVIVTLVRLGL